MSKITNRPMSEYESALYVIAGVLASELINLGGDRAAIAKSLSIFGDDAKADQRTNGSSTLDLFISCFLGGTESDQMAIRGNTPSDKGL